MASVMTPPAASNVALPATQLLINNRWIDSASGRAFATVNPSPGEAISKISGADAPDLD